MIKGWLYGWSRVAIYLSHPGRAALFFTFGILAASTARALEPESIRNFAEGLGTEVNPFITDQQILAAPDLQDFYRRNNHQPVWYFGEDGQKRLHQLVEAIKSSNAHGFNTNRYHLAELTDSSTSDFVKEILATDAFLAQARHRKTGTISPEAVDPGWHLEMDFVDTVSILEKAIAQDRIFESLAQLWPRSAEYKALVAKRAEIAATASVESDIVPPGPPIKPGASGPRIAVLKARLLGPGEHSQDYDAALEKSIKDFQYSAGLDDDGVVGPATLEVLNATHFSWLERIDANLERWRWLPDKVFDTHVRVNIAAFRLRVIKDSTDALTMKVIVGKPYRRTPVFTETIKYMVINPYWNVPYSIATKDKLPLLKKDALAMEAQGYEVRPALEAGFVGVNHIDWREVTPKQFNYLLRQKPGTGNALGHLKLMLPNPFSVYLHGTPDQSLFSKQERGFSSGCIRLSEPTELAAWVLQNDGQFLTTDDLQRQIDNGATQTIYLKKPLPVMIVYFTAFTNDQGQVVFRRDLYQRDKAITDALEKEM